MFDSERANKKTKGESEDLVVETAIDYEEKREKDLKNFKFMPRTVTESEKNNLKNINRILDKKLILLARKKDTKDDEWEFPVTEWNNGESLREVTN